MRKILIATFLALLASSFALGQTSRAEPEKPTHSQLEAEILAACQKFEEAYMKSDSAALALLMAAEFIATDREGVVSDKAQVIAKLNNPNVKLESFGSDEKERRLRIYGDMAVETGRVTIKGTYRGKPFTDIERYTTTWIKRDGRWQVVADHVSAIDE